MTATLSYLFFWLAVVAGLLAWGLAARRAYRLETPPGRRLRVRGADGWELAVFHRAAAQRRFREPVVLAHGLGVTHRFMDFDPPFSLAHALNAAGFDTYAVDFRGTGQSGRWGRTHGVDDHVEKDVPAVLAAVLADAGAEKVLWVGHSLGGLIGLAAAGGPAGGRVAALAALGSPVHFAAGRLLPRALWLGLWLGWPWRLRVEWLGLLGAPLVGRGALPLSDVVMNPRHVPEPVQRKLSAAVLSSMGLGVLRQLMDWMASGEFRSVDGRVDYRARACALDIPLLLAGGSVDGLAAPEEVERAFHGLGSRDKTLRLFGRAHGEAMDYGHADLLFGSGAPQEVYPVVRDWLEARATRLQRATDSHAESPGEAGPT